jgi:predicted NBD/HSP70 family sugar kinase
MVYIGIDLGGTGIAVGIVTEEGKIIQKGSTPTLAMRPYQEIVKDMAAVSMETLKEAGLTLSDVHSIGIGIPGIANQSTGVVVFCITIALALATLIGPLAGGLVATLVAFAIAGGLALIGAKKLKAGL